MLIVLIFETPDLGLFKLLIASSILYLQSLVEYIFRGVFIDSDLFTILVNYHDVNTA